MKLLRLNIIILLLGQLILSSGEGYCAISDWEEEDLIESRETSEVEKEEGSEDEVSLVLFTGNGLVSNSIELSQFYSLHKLSLALFSDKGKSRKLYLFYSCLIYYG